MRCGLIIVILASGHSNLANGGIATSCRPSWAVAMNARGLAVNWNYVTKDGFYYVSPRQVLLFMWDLDPHLIYRFEAPDTSVPQATSRLVQPCWQGIRS